jgi:hypothetical protein
MQNKKLYIILAVVIVIVAASAFVGGQLLNGQVGSLGFLPFGNGGMVSLSVNMTPAPELPTTRPDTTGTFVERKDNTITVQTISMEMGKGGGIVVAVGSADDANGNVTNSSGGGDGPKVEVVVTNQTKIYRDATDMGEPPTSGNQTITVQQVVEPGTLDDLKNQTMVMVWGRKNGDRIIADVISYSNPVIFKRK